MCQHILGNKFEEKLHLGLCEQERSNTADLENVGASSLTILWASSACDRNTYFVDDVVILTIRCFPFTTSLQKVPLWICPVFVEYGSTRHKPHKRTFVYQRKILDKSRALYTPVFVSYCSSNITAAIRHSLSLSNRGQTPRRYWHTSV
jgi:hypothetical protein